MKLPLYAICFILLAGTSLSGIAQTTIPILVPTSTSSYGSGATCNNCNFVISPGVTFTVDNTWNCNTCVFTGGTIVIQPGSNLTLSGVATFKNTSVSVNAAITANSFTATGGSITMSGNANLTANSASLSSGTTLTMSGSASQSINNGFSVVGSTVYLNGNNTLSSGSMTITGSSWFRVGDGTLANTANVSVNNTFNVDAASNMGIANKNNYLFAPNSSFGNYGNCNGNGNQNCGYVYGCATINNNTAVTCTLLATADLHLTATPAGPGRVSLVFTDLETSPADHYRVQRNTGGNGNTGDNEWNTLATINAGAYTSGEYRFADADAPAGSLQYRVERIEQNGKILYSSIASVSVEQTGAAIGIHPNPAAGGTFFISTANTGEIIVNIFTMTGQLLLHTNLQGQIQYALHLPAQSLTLGSVVVQTIGQSGARSFTVLVR